MPVDPVSFKSRGREFRYTPWGAFKSVSEWGDLGADLGDGIAEHLLGGDLTEIIEGIQSSEGLSMAMIQAVARYLGDSDLGERCSYYLASGIVEVRSTDDGDTWHSLHGEDAGEQAAAASVDGLDLLAAAWHVVREGMRPLLAPLRSLAAAQGSKSTPTSSESAESA